MKKFTVVLALICFAAGLSFAQARDDQEIIIKAGIQPQATATLDGDNYDTNIGISVGAEYFKYFGNIIALGAGAMYDLPRKFKDDDLDGSISFVPIYVGLKVRTPLHGLENNYAFISGRVGYSAFVHDDVKFNNVDFIDSGSGGLYYAVGIGASISFIIVEAIYSVSNFSYDTKILGNKKSYDEKYSTVGIYAGFKFE